MGRHTDSVKTRTTVARAAGNIESIGRRAKSDKRKDAALSAEHTKHSVGVDTASVPVPPAASIMACPTVRATWHFTGEGLVATSVDEPQAPTATAAAGLRFRTKSALDNQPGFWENTKVLRRIPARAGDAASVLCLLSSPLFKRRHANQALG